MSTFNGATLARVLEILASDHADEALAAARLASAMVREAGLSWDEVIARDIRPRPSGPQPTGTDGGGGSGRPHGSGPFGYRRDRELTSHEQFFMVLLSPRTPPEVKRTLRDWEVRVLDGEITPQEEQDLRFMYRNFVA